MKTSLSILFSLISLFTFAQSEQKEIIEQVWKPFIKAANELDTDGYLSLYSKDVVRATSDNGRVMGYAEYAKVHASGDQNYKINKSQKKLELRFKERWVNQDLAYEVGIYKMQIIKPSGGTTVTHGEFHVVLRKENGVWKILMDTDSSEGGAIGEKEFLYARPMEL